MGTFVLIILAGALSYLIAYNGKVYPNLSVAGVPMAGNTLEGASVVLSKNIVAPSEIALIYQDQAFEIKTSDIELSYNFSASAAKAYEFTRTGNIFYDFENRAKLLFYPKNLKLVASVNNDKLAKIVSIIAGQISIDPVDPSITKTNDGISVNKGLAGKEVNREKLMNDILQNLSLAAGGQIPIPVDTIDNTLNEAEAKDFALRAEKFLGKSISLKFEYDDSILRDTDIFKLIDPKGGYGESAITAVVQKTAALFERDPQNPKFVFENNKVIEFQPALDGVKVDEDAFKKLLVEKLDQFAASTEKELDINIPVVKTPPEITTDKVNNLGIKELIGRGSSTYFHSIPGRVHNVALAASRINGTLVKPGETFSFNNTLGDVSAFTGYQQAYVISNGKTILGDGGGVCQVSSTLFRAILNAGLPVAERQAHSYRVGYYE